ncbi:MAG: hypothetical protein EBT33_18770, partial [Betaproteobacteria bacterium]|nr:hypothetical protein [Betaproteobacteria bacterium]
GGAIQLAGANRFGGNVTATAGGALTVRDGDAMSGSFTSVGDMRLEAAGNLTLAGSVGGAGSDLTLIALAGGTVTLGSIGSVPGDLTVYASGAITQTGALSVAGETRIEGQQLSFTGTGSTALSQAALPIQISTAEGRWVAVADRTAIAVSGTASALAGATVERVVLAQAGSGSANAVVQAAGDIAVNSAAGRWVAAASRSAVDLSGTASTAAGSTLTLTFTDAAGKTVQRTATVSNGAWTLSGINLFTLADSGPVRLTITGAGATRFEQAAFLNVGTPAPESATDTVFPQITRVDGPAAGVYAAGRTMMFAVRFSETVNVDTAAGSPTLELALNTPAGNQTGRAEYMPALSSAATKVFRYTVPVGTTVNAAQPGALVLNSAALSDVAGNRIGALTVRFTDALGASVVRNASVANGSWSLSGVDLSSLTGRGSVRITVASASGALLERDAFINVGEAPAATGIDRTVPSIVRIDVPAEGRYEAGREMVFKLAMSEAADIDTTSGSPTLDLALQTDAGARSASATFDASASTPTTKVFRYVVPAGEAVVSASVSRLQLNRAAVADGAQNRLGVETSITLDDAANVFGGSVYASGGVIVLRDSTALQAVLAASADAVLRAGGAITVSATVSGSGSDLSLVPASGGTVSFGRTAVSGDLTVSTDGAAISQTGWLAVGGLAQISAAGQSVTLANPDNDFGGRTVVTGGTVSVADINALTLEARASGNLTVRSGGELAIDPTVSGSLEITAIGGSVRFARTLDLSAGATLRIDGADAVRFDAGIGLTGPAYADPVRITSSRAGGSVVSFAAGLLAGDSNSFELAGVGRFAPQVRLDNGRLVLDDLAVQGMAGAALALRPVNGRSVALLEVADLDIASSGGMQLDGQIRAATLLARSTAGAISQGAGASLRIDGSTRLEASGNISVLSADNRFADTVRLSGAAVALRDGNDLDVVLSASGDSVLASAGALSVVATVTGAGNDLQLESAGAITLGELAVGGALSTSGNGALTQTAALRVTGPLSVSAGSGAVTLEHTGNQFDGAVAVVSSGAVAVRDTNALSLAVTGSANVRAASGGDLAVTSAGAQALVLAVSSPGDVTIQSAGALDLTAPLAAASSDLTVTAGGTLKLVSLQVGGGVSLTAAGAISQGETAITVGGAADIRSNAGAVTLARIGNVFGGTVKLAGTSAQLRDTGPLGIELNLQGDTVIEATGDISLSGSVTGPGSDLRVVPGAGAKLTLGATTVGGALDASSQGAFAAGVLNVTGDARIVSAGAVTQTGDWTIAGATTLTATGQAVTLGRAGNDFGGAVSIASGVLQIRDRSALDLSVAASGAVTARAGGILSLSGTITGEGNGLTADVAGAVLGALTVPGNVSLASTGAISQSGALVVGGTTTVSAAGQNVALSSANNQFTGNVNVTGAAVTVIDSDTGLAIGFDASAAVRLESAGALRVLRGVGTGAGSVTSLKSAGATVLDSLELAGGVALSAGGAVTQGGALLVGAASTIDAGTHAITLEADANRFVGTLGVSGKTVALRSAGALTLALAASDDVTVTSAGTLTVSGAVSGSGSDLTLTGKGSEGVQLGSLAVGGALSLNAAGPITQAAGSAIKVGANAVVDAGDAAVTLTAAGNDLAGELSVAGGRISVGSDKSLTVEIDSTSDARVQAGVGLTVKRASVQGEASDLRLESLGAISLGEIVVGDGLSISAGGAVTQTAALRVAGASDIIATGQTVTLANEANDFGGLTKLQAKQASVRDSNDLRIELTAQADSSVNAAGALNLAGSLTGAGTNLTAKSSALLSVEGLAVAGALKLEG